MIDGTHTVFNAHSEKSRQDFEALTEKHCPRCGNPDLLAIMVAVPQYVRDALNNEKKKRGL
jgi:cytochrome c-type biogenesis protein CcmH/NrfF